MDHGLCQREDRNDRRAGKPRRLRDILFPNGNQENSNDNYQIEPDDELENPDRTNTNGRVGKTRRLREVTIHDGVIIPEETNNSNQN